MYHSHLSYDLHPLRHNKHPLRPPQSIPSLLPTDDNSLHPALLSITPAARPLPPTNTGPLRDFQSSRCDGVYFYRTDPGRRVHGRYDACVRVERAGSWSWHRGGLVVLL